ncbi:AAA family ATPase [Succinivibrio faecicola]|uniref:AAA family ATPase n=1 Tax=Succinivibrio faecicola TaxID=2820300 RepID=A0ABS7DKN9_9GAMM|nr:AAA family ATPase [Succinivibrio faecicola]MBW7571111.1 AAA family ATPase [Succinivibrio faecicola]
MVDECFKKLPFGTEEFSELRTEDYYFIDKSSYIKKVFENSASVILFTRPRRFGKTLLMDMFKSFLRVAPDGSSNREYKEKLFAGLEILKDKEFTDKYLGQFPVISFSLKGVFGKDYNAAYEALAFTLSNLFKDFLFLNDSEKLLDSEKESLKLLQDFNYLSTPKAEKYIVSSLEFLSSCLYKHFSKKVIILIDEYDVPLAKASENGYHKEMVTLISSFFNVMKSNLLGDEGNGSPIKKIVLTGCLKVVKNSIFTGVNNLYVNTILSESPSFDSMIGFTKEETVQILKDYELDDYFPFVKENYDGYRFNKKEMFSPWVLVSFIDYAIKRKASSNPMIAPNFWINSTSSNALLSYVGYLTDEDNENMQKLMDGECIETTINDSMNYDDLSMHKAEDFYTLLLFTGYLTVDSYRTENISGYDKTIYSLRIPNLEIRECFIQNIKAHFDAVVNQGENKAKLIANALFEGDFTVAKKHIDSLLNSYVSIRDFATKAKPENFYHGFLSGVFTNCSNFITDFKSNSESGDGYADLKFVNKTGDKAVILEIKASSKIESVIEDANHAIKQIEDKGYAKTYTTNPFINEIYGIGISFYNKQCYIACKKINKTE